MRNKRGKIGYMAIKKDLEKANDRLKWDFVEDVLKKLDLPYPIQRVIMYCTTTFSINVLWHRSKIEDFKPSRGIR